MASRRCPSAMPRASSSQWPSLSGPRCVMPFIMATQASCASALLRHADGKERKPEMPHMVLVAYWRSSSWYKSLYAPTQACMENNAVTRVRPLTPMTPRSGFNATDSNAAANASGSLAGTTRPVSPWMTASALPPTSVTIIGRRAAIPSRIALEKPSSWEHKTPISAAHRRSGTSARDPRKRTCACSPEACARVSSLSRIPSSRPIHNKTQFGGKRFLINPSASIRSACPLYGIKFATITKTRVSSPI